MAKDEFIYTSRRGQAPKYGDLLPVGWYLYDTDPIIVSETIFNHLYYFKEDSNSQKKEPIPKENLVSEEGFDNFIDQLLDKLYKENSYNIKFSIKEKVKKYSSKIYEIAGFQIESFIDFSKKEEYVDRLKSFKSVLNDVSGYILAIKQEDLGCFKDFKDYFKHELISGIVLSFIVNNFNSNFDSNIASIDNIINFLESLSFYNDDYVNKTDLPKIAEIKNFACILVADMIASNFYYHDDEKNYINFLYYKWFSRESEQLTSFIDNNIEFINFNYDLSLYNSFEITEFYNIISSKDRKEALQKMKEKLEKSHVYGKIKKHTSQNYIDKNKCFLPFFKECLMYIGGNSDINSIGETIKKRKEDPKISLIRTEPSPDEITANFEKIKNIDEIYILGFGFDEYNLKNIGISASDAENLKKVENKTVYATNHGDLPRIRLTLERIFAVKLYKESELQEGDKKHKSELQEGDKKHSFWRSRDDATINKRNNNVFVSTKPVYRALSEDFLA